jgi:ribose/xylose/arabinose/galactoside ABC-type transport system permease subunit
MWDIFIAFIFIGAGAILAFYELQRWLASKRWIHLAAIAAAVVSEVALTRGFLEALIVLVFAIILAFIAESRKSPGEA